LFSSGRGRRGRRRRRDFLRLIYIFLLPFFLLLLLMKGAYLGTEGAMRKGLLCMWVDLILG
jgi:hypothetical protein